MAANGQLVFTDVDKVTFKGVGDTSNAVIDTTTGKIGVGVDSPDANLHVLGNCFVSTNLELGGTMTMGTVTVNARHELSAITATGNTTPHTVEFQNAETGLVTTGNVSVGKELTVTGNVAVDTDTLFVDTVNDRVGVGTSTPGAELHIAGSGAVVVPSGTTAQKPTGVTGMIRFNTGVGKLEFYNGTVWSFLGGVSATGGTITTEDGYTIHTFTTGGSFTVVSGGEVEYLVVAGGGGGGADRGGGGGAGGMLTGTLPNVTPGSYTITIGSGGAGALADNVTASNGNDSSALGIISSGGGGGGSENTSGANGGSGGGASYSRTAGGGTTGQGNYGANGVSNPRRTGGGGGAGAAATNQNGGVGLQSSISGTSTYYAGGGGGGDNRDGTSGGVIYGNEGNGGGGRGGIGSNGNGTAGTPNTGGGGGGGGYFNDGHGGSGGSGIVIIRYLN